MLSKGRLVPGNSLLSEPYNRGGFVALLLIAFVSPASTWAANVSQCDNALVKESFSATSSVNTDFRLAELVSKETYDNLKSEFKGTTAIYGVPVGADYGEYKSNAQKMTSLTNSSLTEDVAHNVAWRGVDPNAVDGYKACLWAATASQEGLHLLARNATEDQVTVLVRWVPPTEGPRSIAVKWNLKKDQITSNLPMVIHMNTEERVVIKRPTKTPFIVVVDNGKGRNDDLVVTPYIPAPALPPITPPFVEVKKIEAIAASCGAIGGKACSGSPTVNKCIVVDSDRDVFETETANIVDQKPEGDAKVWLTEVKPKKVCATANASVTSGGLSSRVSANIYVMERHWQADPESDLFRYLRR